MSGISIIKTAHYQNNTGVLCLYIYKPSWSGY